MNNILLESFQTPFHTAPFDQIKNTDYLPAFQELIKHQKQKLNT